MQLKISTLTYLLLLSQFGIALYLFGYGMTQPSAEASFAAAALFGVTSILCAVQGDRR